jgi:DNA polymerase/3'-5' exonuclease PolX
MVSNADVVRKLDRIADLLEIRGENMYKVRAAHRQAGVQVDNLGRSPCHIAGGDVFRNDDGVRLAGETEDDGYAALSLSWIPPQRREDPAEIGAAALTPVATEV